MTTRSPKSTHLFAASFAVAATALAAVGCSSANTTPTSNDYDDVAQSTAALVATASGGGELGSMYDSASIAIGITPLDVSVNASGSFDGNHAGVTYNFAVSCTDAGGASVAHCGAATNDATASVSWTGNMSLPSFTADVTRNGNWSLTGLQSGTATFNGTGTFTLASTFSSAFRNETASTNLSYAATYSSITYGMLSHQATGGSVHYTIDASHAASSTSVSSNGSFSIDAVLTFAAGGGGTLVLDGSHKYLVSSAGGVLKI
jgi:hypothetical protein